MAIKAIPHTQWYGKVPDIRHLRNFGHLVKVLIHPNIRVKGSYHAEEGKIVGYCPDSKSYKVWIPSRRTFVKSRSVLFQDSSAVVPRVQPYNPNDLEDSNLSPYIRSQRPISIPIICQHQPLPAQTSMDIPSGRLDIQRELDPRIFRPDSSLTNVDVEEVDGPLPSVNDNILPCPAEGTIPLVRQTMFPDFNEQGFRVGPEEQSEHLQFQQYGRTGGRSQHNRKPVDKAYHALASFFEFARQLHEPNEI
jgi:hypothetical protein